MAIRESDEQGRGHANPAGSWEATRASVEDARQAARLAEGLGRDGWRVGWSGPVDGSWEAFVGTPSMAAPARARGLTRVSAITAAHLGAIHQGERVTWPPGPRCPVAGPDRRSEFLYMMNLFEPT